ncbi:MAG: RagB/SusD family nutrient uptake outer membrane protein [Saprospiraceae bacterium]|nr:RagB/SusD family nutrient uptake outer membrane protein [Saprospiraceae bacterium]
MKFLYKSCFVLALIFAVQSCDIDTIENPNGPTAESLLDGASLADLRLMAHGLEALLRNDMQFHYWTTSMVAREYYDLNGTDPRYTGELLGAQGATLDNNGFLTTRAFASAYRVVRNAINLITATQNSSASLSAEETNGIVGYAKTLQAYKLLHELLRQYQNGIRLDVEDPDNLGSFVSFEDGLAGIASLLDEAASMLSNAGSKFVFNLSSGFAGFNTPATFRQFNRAIAARVALYQGNSSAALSAISGSFFNINGSMNTGVYHAFGTGGNDQRNPMFNVPNSDLFTVHPSWLADAEPGDLRVDAKTTPLDPDELTLPVTLDGLSGDVQVTIFSSNTDPFPMIRNEELILIYAEAQVGQDMNEALAAINAVRNAADIGEYQGATDNASLIDEILHQRRYSLFGEGHRWVDLRRFNRLDEVPLDRPGDVVHVQFPRPVLENE